MASLEIPHQISPGAEKFEMAKAKPRQHKCGFRLGVLRHYLGISSPEDTNVSRRYFSSALLSGAETFKDPVFVSLDTEGHNRGCIRKIGLSRFDKRNLKNLNSTSGLSKILASYNYILYKDVKAEQDRRFKFGTSERMDGRWTHWLLEKVLRTGSPDLDRTEPRNVVLVGHSIFYDLHALARLEKGKFDFISISDVPIVDKTNLVGGVLKLKYCDKPSLAELVDWLEIDRKGMIWHNTGNDANATMKLMLTPALKKCCEADLTEQQQERTKLLEGIVRSSRATSPTDIDREEYDKSYRGKINNRFDDWVHAFEGGLGFVALDIKG